MSTNKIKKVIKACVRECLEEILAEKKALAESASRESRFLEDFVSPSTSQPAERWKPEPKPTAPTIDKEHVRNLLRERMGLNDMNNPMIDLFEDTAKSDNPILKGEAAGPNELEHVSEDSMQKIGIFNKDWSKFL